MVTHSEGSGFYCTNLCGGVSFKDNYYFSDMSGNITMGNQKELSQHGDVSAFLKIGTIYFLRS